MPDAQADRPDAPDHPDATDLDAALARVRERATGHDRRGSWPGDDLADLAAAGAARAAVPVEFGGDGASGREVALLTERIAAASLAVALVASQRDSAADFLAASDNGALRADLLPRLASGGAFATIGIAQLTTSRQGGPPALRATPDGDGGRGGGYVLDGTVPWSTGADHADFIVVGAALGDGRQVLAALPTDLPGVSPDAPFPLAAMSASHTGAVRLDAVRLSPRHLLAGPAANVLASRAERRAAGRAAGQESAPLGQSYLATGHARAALDLISAHDSPAARSAHAALSDQLAATRARLLNFPPDGEDPEAGPRLRAECAELSLRAANVAVALYKGSALSLDHPAQRLAREAMFLLVWSCPNPVIEHTVRALTRE